MSTEDDVDKGVRILSFDSGGSGTYTQLIMVKEYTSRLAIDRGVEETDVYPADYFDLIGGVGFGGLIAIMLVYLRMNVDETIEALLVIAEAIFPHNACGQQDPERNTTKLRATVEDMLLARQVPLDMKMNDKRSLSSQCKVALFATTDADLSHVTIFRSYTTRGLSVNPTIVEAICATMATPSLFSPIKIGQRLREQNFVGSPMGANNPTRELLKEASNVFGKDRRVAQVISIGSGQPRLLSIDELVAAEVISRLLKEIASDCEMVAKELSTRLFAVDSYLRLNVEKGIEYATMEDWSGLGAMETHTRAYLETSAISEAIEVSLRRLKERIGTVTLSQINHSSSIKVIVKTAPPVSPCYVARDREWSLMLRHLAEPDSAVQTIFPITGMGGCGKTQMVSYFLREKHALFSHIVFVDASSPASIKADLQAWSRSFGDDHEQDVWEDALKLLASRPRDERWVLVFDNADNPSLDLVSFFPKCYSGTIIITSRNRDVGNLSSSCHLELGQMEASEALSALLQSARRELPIPPEELESAHALIKELGSLAVALVHAGTYCYQLSSFSRGDSQLYSFTKYLALFSSQRSALMKKAGPSSLDGYQRGVYTTLDLSYQAIPPVAQDFLHFASQFHHSDISLAMLEAAAEKQFRDRYPFFPRPEQYQNTISRLSDLLCTDGKWSELQALDTIQTLRSFSLVSTTTVADSILIQLHPLVQAWARDMLSPTTEEYCLMARQIVTSCYQADIRVYRYLLPHINELLRKNTGPSLHINDRVAMGKILEELGHNSEAKTLFELVLKSLGDENLSEEDTQRRLIATGWIAGSLTRQGRWNEAEPLSRQYLDDCRDNFGKDHPQTIAATSALAYVLQSQGRWIEAEKLDLEVLEQDKRVLGEEHPNSIVAARNLARNYVGQGRLDEAEPLERECLKQAQRIFGTDSPESVRSAANLADTLHAQGKWGEAEKLQKEVLDRQRKALGMEHPDAIKAANNLSITYADLGKWDEAEALQLYVLDQRQRLYGLDHPDTIRAAANLACTYHSQRRLDDAEKLELRVLEQQRRILGINHPEVTVAAGNLATTYCDQKRWNEAEALALEVLEQRRKTLGKEHHLTIMAASNLVPIYNSLKRWTEAEKFGAEVLEQRIKFTGKEHPNTSLAQYNLGIVYLHQGKAEEAEPLLASAIEHSMAVMGVKHPHTQIFLVAMAKVYEQLGKHDEAEETKKLLEPKRSG